MLSTLGYVTHHDLIFLGLAMACGKAIADPAMGIEYSTVVTAMCRNGTDFGIRVSGLGENWFTATFSEGRWAVPAWLLGRRCRPGYG